jgi:cell division protein FtsL
MTTEGKPNRELNVQEFKARQRKLLVAVVLSFVAIVVATMASLIINYNQTMQAKRQLALIEQQTQAKKNQLRDLDREITLLSRQARDYKIALNDVVSGNQEAARVLTKTVESSSNIAQSIPRVFVHSRGIKNKELALKVAQNLRLQGFIVPAPDDNSISSHVSQAEIVFFQSDASTDTDIELIRKALVSSGIPPEIIWQQQDVGHLHPPRTYTIYLPE